MEDIDLEERVSDLENRVAFLERELETSYEERKFERNIGEMFPESATINFRDGRYGYFARVTDIDGDDVQMASERLDGISSLEYGYAVTETSEGLGMEVWTGPEV